MILLDSFSFISQVYCNYCLLSFEAKSYILFLHIFHGFDFLSKEIFLPNSFYFFLLSHVINICKALQFSVQNQIHWYFWSVIASLLFSLKTLNKTIEGCHLVPVIFHFTAGWKIFLQFSYSNSILNAIHTSLIIIPGLPNFYKTWYTSQLSTES